VFTVGSRDGVLGHGDAVGNVRDVLHPDDLPFGLDVIGDLIRHPGKSITVYGRARAVDGSYRLLEFHLTNRLDDPLLGGIVVRTREATEQGRASVPALIRSLVDVLPAAVVIISADRVVLYANPAAGELLDRTLEELRAEGWAPPTPLDKEEHTVEVQHHGRWLSARVVPRIDDEGHVEGWIGVLEDITERRLTTQALSYQATHDALTDLPNRGALVEELRRLLADAERGPVSLLYVDLDGFKAVNDRYGHAAGDRVLVELGRRLVGVARATDVVARIGGDEFAVLCRDTAPAVAEVIAGRLAEVVAQPVELDGASAAVGASVGRVTVAASDTGRDAEDVLNQADLAMYEVKRGAR